MPAYDSIVIGLGATGGAALAELARRGRRTLGIEQFHIANQRGSSHGETRIIRLGYYEHPSYVPLVRRAYELWRDLERNSGRRLLHVTGILEMGPPEGELVAGTLAASRAHGIAHEILDAAALMRRFPAFRVPRDFVGVHQADGGFLDAEDAVLAQVGAAQAHGAQVRTALRVRAIEPLAGGVRVATDNGAFEAASVVVSAGAWLPKLLPGLQIPLRATRQAVGWFEPAEPAPFARGACPVFMIESKHGIHYGFPLHGRGVKIAKHFHREETLDPDLVAAPFAAADEAIIRTAIADHIPGANGPLARSATCLYTMAPDGDFILDRLPGAPQIVMASACSGHGFKFAPVLGEILADLATDRTPAHDISRFRLARFG